MSLAYCSECHIILHPDPPDRKSKGWVEMYSEDLPSPLGAFKEVLRLLLINRDIVHKHKPYHAFFR